jgi:hypothetical protein
MTPDENDKLRQIHDALLKTEPGKDLPLLQRLARMENEWARAKWGARAAMVTFVTIGGLAVTYEKIKGVVAGVFR